MDDHNKLGGDHRTIGFVCLTSSSNKLHCHHWPLMDCLVRSARERSSCDTRWQWWPWVVSLIKSTLAKSVCPYKYLNKYVIKKREGDHNMKRDTKHFILHTVSLKKLNGFTAPLTRILSMVILPPLTLYHK